jgi:pilus assembly protein Flp/PilA
MRSIAKFIKQLRRDEDGASLIEYTVLLAIILIATIGLIAAVGTWVSGRWSALNSALPTNP